LAASLAQPSLAAVLVLQVEVELGLALELLARPLALLVVPLAVRQRERWPQSPPPAACDPRRRRRES
jgi:hypothetical protein